MAVSRKEFTRHSRPVLKTRRWKVLRQIILERDGYACTCCGTRRGRLEIDHVKPVRDRPDLAFAPANLATLCPRCHAAKTRIECGWKPTDPARLDWRKAVADLAPANPPSKGNDHA